MASERARSFAERCVKVYDTLGNQMGCSLFDDFLPREDGDDCGLEVWTFRRAGSYMSDARKTRSDMEEAICAIATALDRYDGDAWTAITEKLPEEGVAVEAIGEGWRRIVKRSKLDGNDVFICMAHQNDFIEIEGATHWRPLSALPNGDDKNK